MLMFNYTILTVSVWALVRNLEKDIDLVHSPSTLDQGSQQKRSLDLVHSPSALNLSH